MGKKVRVLMLAMMVVCLAASSSFAGTTLTNYNGAAGNISVALETLGADRTVTFNGTGNAAGTIGIGYTAGQALAEGNLLVVTLTGAKFPATAINICGVGVVGGADGVIGNATPTANATSAAFQLNAFAANVASGGLIFLTNGGCDAAITANITPIIAATASAGTPTIQIVAQTAGGVTIDSSTAKRLATISAEYASATNVTNHIIDYLATPFNGTKIITAGLASNVTADGSNNAAGNNTNITKAALNYAVNTGTAVVGAANAPGLTVSAVVSVQDSAAWQGISRLYVVPGAAAACNIANNVSTVNTAPSGIVALNVTAGAAGAFNGSLPVQLALCVEANGTASLQTRTLQTSTKVNVTGTGANDPAAAAYANAMNWFVNAYQGVLPWIINGATLPTYCLINNADSTLTATVTIDVISSESTVVLTNAPLGTIAAKTSKLLLLTGNSVYFFDGTGTPVNVSSLGADKRYSARVTATVAPANASIACIQADPAGAKRSVPVY